MNRFTAIALLTAACATVDSPVKREAAAEAFDVTPMVSTQGDKPPPPKDFERWAAGYRRSVECGIGARDLTREYGHDIGWAALKACVARGNFTMLEQVTEHWGEDLRTKPDASVVLAHIIAARGGNIGTDLMLLQEKRVPLFELGAAVRAPPTFKGRYVVFVGRIGEVKNVKGKTELALSELMLQGESVNVITGRRQGVVRDSAGSASGQAGPYPVGGTYNTSSMTQAGHIETRTSNEFVESGETALIRLKAPDPFLSTERNFLFLVRFDGVVVGDSEAEEGARNTALGTLVAYFDVQSGL